MGPRASLDRRGKSRPTGILSSHRPARNQSLYRLSYPGPRHALGSQLNSQSNNIFNKSHFNISHFNIILPFVDDICHEDPETKI